MTVCEPAGSPALDPDRECEAHLNDPADGTLLADFLGGFSTGAHDTATTVNHVRVAAGALRLLAETLADPYALLRTGHAQLVAAGLGEVFDELTVAARHLGLWLEHAHQRGEGGDPKQAIISLSTLSAMADAAARHARTVVCPPDLFPPFDLEFLTSELSVQLRARGIAVQTAAVVEAGAVRWDLHDADGAELTLTVVGELGWELSRNGAHVRNVGLPTVPYAHPAYIADLVARHIGALAAGGAPDSPQTVWTLPAGDMPGMRAAEASADV